MKIFKKNSSGREAMLCQGDINKTSGVKFVFALLKYFIGFKNLEILIQTHCTISLPLDALQCIFVF